MKNLAITRNTFRSVIGLMLLCLQSGGVAASPEDGRYYANVHDMLVYDDPSPNSRAYEGPTIGHEFRKADAPRTVPPGWLYVEYEAAGSIDRYAGWVREKDVVHYGSFKEVARDWPIRYYCYWQIDGTPEPDDPYAAFNLPGTLVFESTFQENGTARINVFDNRPRISFSLTSPTEEKKRSERETHVGQIYRSGGVVMLKYGKDRTVGFTYGLDEKKQTFFGGESAYVSGQGAPSNTGKRAYWTLYRFGEPVHLDKNAAKYCKHAPAS